MTTSSNKNSQPKIKIRFWISIVLFFGLMFLLASILENRWYSWVILVLTVASLVYVRVRRNLQRRIYTLFWVIAIIVSILSIVYGRQDLSVSFRGTLLSKSVKTVNHLYYKINGETLIYSVSFKQQTPYVFGKWKVPKGYNNLEIPLEHSRAFLLTKEDSKHHKVVYQIHGGGYVGVFNNLYNKTALLYSKAYYDAEVFSIDYRTAPDYKFPSALEDAVEGYLWLLKKGYKAEDIIVCGDSAGGGLSLALTMYLRDNNIALPRMLILSSPQTNPPP